MTLLTKHTHVLSYFFQVIFSHYCMLQFYGSDSNLECSCAFQGLLFRCYVYSVYNVMFKCQKVDQPCSVQCRMVTLGIIFPKFYFM